MASGTTGESNDDSRDRRPGGRIVYTRRVRKKADKTSNNNDSATTSTSTQENRAAATTSVNHFTAPTPSNNSSPAAATTAAANVHTDATCEDPKDSADVPPPTFNGGNPAVDTTIYGSEVDSVRDPVANNVESSDERLGEQLQRQVSSPERSGDGDADFSQRAHQLEERQHQQRTSSPSELNIRNQVNGGSGSENAELQILENSLPDVHSEPPNVGTLSPNHSRDETLQASEDEPPNLRVPSPLPNGNELQTTEEIAAGRMPSGNGTVKDVESVPMPLEVSMGNEPTAVNGVVKPLVISRVDDRVRFNLTKATAKNEILELRKKLESELDLVRSLVKQIEAKKLQLTAYDAHTSNGDLSNRGNLVGTEGGSVGGYPQLQPSRTDIVERKMSIRVNTEVNALRQPRAAGLTRVNSDVGAVRNLESRQYNRQLSVAVMENNHRTGEFVEKEKRTPKANQYYRNSEFLLGKDRLPPESNKRQKTSNRRKHSGDSERGFSFGFDKSGNQLFKSCSNLLQKLMKHKHGWVFNEPVNAKALGLVDYHDIIKHPMDFGTIKTRLSQNWYKSPRDFAEDVRLVFRNAMTYNPKGQDVHIMAEQLSQIFEDRWAAIETEYNPYWRYQTYQDAGFLTPTSRKASQQSHYTPAPIPFSAPIPGFVQAPYALTPAVPMYAPPAPQMRTLDKSETMTTSMAVDPNLHRPHVGRTPVPKKPKAKDPNKRDMTYDEKQRLSTNLQSLPTDKLDAIVQIIKKRNTALSQRDDEIEVDIDNVDPETLWELDRFVTNYKKSLSKNKRKAELALQARTATNQSQALMTATSTAADVQIGSEEALEKGYAPPDTEGGKQGYNGSRSSSSSSSSSDSGSSSSDSDSDSSSADGSDAGHSPGT